MSTLRLQRFVRTSLWLLPLGCVAAGGLLAVGTLAVDRATDYRLVSQSLTGTPSDAQTILSSFATALVSLTTLVLTVTLVAVQLAMGQFSPRIVGALLTDRWSQLAIGLFGASFLVAVLTLREVRGSDTGTVPGVSMLLSLIYVPVRDVQQIWVVFARMLFFLTPVFYPIELAPAGLQRFLILNPLALVIVQSRHALIDPSAPTALDAAGGVGWVAVSLAFIVVIVAAGLWLYHRYARRLVERI